MNEMNNRPNPEEGAFRDSKEITHTQTEDKMDLGNDFKSKRIGKKTMPYGAERGLNAYKTQSK